MSSLYSLWHNNKKLRFLVIGIWNTLAGYACFAGLYLTLNQHIPYMAIAVLSHLIAVTQSYLTQRRLVFRSTGSSWEEYIRFHIAHLASLAIGLVLLPLLVEVFQIPPIIAQGIVISLIVVGSYFIHQHFTFRQK